MSAVSVDDVLGAKALLSEFLKVVIIPPDTATELWDRCNRGQQRTRSSVH